MKRPLRAVFGFLTLILGMLVIMFTAFHPAADNAHRLVQALVAVVGLIVTLFGIAGLNEEFDVI
jgi:hypothetical protein